MEISGKNNFSQKNSFFSSQSLDKVQKHFYITHPMFEKHSFTVSKT